MAEGGGSVFDGPADHYSPMETSARRRVPPQALVAGGVLLSVAVLTVLVLARKEVGSEITGGSSAQGNEPDKQGHSTCASGVTIKDRLMSKDFCEEKSLNRIEEQMTCANITGSKKMILSYSPLHQGQIPTCSPTDQTLCEFTTNRSKIDQADVVIFQECDIMGENIPERKTYSQWWIYSNLRPNERKPHPTKYKGYFNLSATSNLQSDLPMLSSYWLRPTPSFKTTINTTIPQKDKSDGIITVIYSNNCEEYHILNEKYNTIFDQLKENNVTVMWYGRCNDSTFESDCQDLSSDACFEQINSYKFALAFEISNTRFISEIFFDPLRNLIIPIVTGNNPKYLYDALAPYNSFIYFLNTTELIIKLKELNTNDQALQEYHRWRKEQEGVLKPFSRWYCQVCGVATNWHGKRGEITVNDIDTWR